MNARQKAKHYKKKYEELLHKRSNNSFINAAEYMSSNPFFPLEPNQSMLSYHVGEFHISKPYFSDIDSSSSAEETFKPCQTMEEKNECSSKS